MIYNQPIATDLEMTEPTNKDFIPAAVGMSAIKATRRKERK